MDSLAFPRVCTHPTAAAPRERPDETQDIGTATAISVTPTAATTTAL
jgi:hypothetical protein